MAPRVFLRSDTSSVNISAAHGGCGVGHVPDEDHAIECAVCGPVLIRDYGAAYIENEREMTPDEEREQKKLSESGTLLQQQMANAMGREAARLVKDARDVEMPKVGKRTRAPRKKASA